MAQIAAGGANNSHSDPKHIGVFNVPCLHCGRGKVGQAGVDDHSTVWRLNGRRKWGVHKGDCARLPGQAVSGGRAISEWVFREVRRESNCLPVKKNRRFSDFLPPGVPFRCGG